MAKNIEPKLKKIGDYLKLEEDTVFTIPEYQRAYSWGIDNCDKLWQDINDFVESESKDRYFFGTIIINCQDNDTKYGLIDGQQRTTTFLLLLKALLVRINIAIERTASDEDSASLCRGLQERRRRIMGILYKAETEDISDKPDAAKDAEICRRGIILENFSINALYNEQKVKDPEIFTESIKVDDRVLRTVVSHLEAINLNKTDLDVKGVAFEQFMDGFFKGDFGQYFTPRPIIEFCVKMMKPEQDWDVLDPSCGSGGFLLHALDYMRNQAGDYYEKGTVDYFNYWHDFAAKHLFGIEINDEIARVAKMNMIVHDDGHTNVISHDALESIDKMHDHNRGFAENRFDLILTNPPFGSTINLAEKPYLSTYELGNNVDAKGKKKPRKNQSSEVLFIERIWQFLKPGTGKAAIVLPDGILTNSSMQYVRGFILEKFQLLAVVSLPQCAFAHFGAGVKASVIFVRKRKDSEKPNGDEAIFMAAPELIGYDATGRKTESQLDEIVSKYEEFRKDATPFFA